MTLQVIFIYVVIGVLAAFLAAWLMPKSRLGLLGDLVAGVAGSFIGGWIFLQLGVYMTGSLWPVVAAIVGALMFTGIPRLLGMF